MRSTVFALFVLTVLPAFRAAQVPPSAERIVVAIARVRETSSNDTASHIMRVYRTQLEVIRVLRGDNVLVGQKITDLSVIAPFSSYPDLVIGHDYLLVLDGANLDRVLFGYDTSVSAREHEGLRANQEEAAMVGETRCARFRTLFEANVRPQAAVEQELSDFVETMSRETPMLDSVYRCLGQPASRRRNKDSSLHTYRTGGGSVAGLGTVVYAIQFTFDNQCALTRVRVSPEQVGDQHEIRALDSETIAQHGLLHRDIRVEED